MVFRTAKDGGGSTQQQVCLQTCSPRMYRTYILGRGCPWYKTRAMFLREQKLAVSKCTRMYICWQGIYAKTIHPCIVLTNALRRGCWLLFIFCRVADANTAAFGIIGTYAEPTSVSTPITLVLKGSLSDSPLIYDLSCRKVFGFNADSRSFFHLCTAWKRLIRSVLLRYCYRHLCFIKAQGIPACSASTFTCAASKFILILTFFLSV